MATLFRSIVLMMALAVHSPALKTRKDDWWKRSDCGATSDEISYVGKDCDPISANVNTDEYA